MWASVREGRREGKITGCNSRRRKDITKIETEKTEYKSEIDERLERERNREEEVSASITQLDAAVKVYQDKGGGFLQEDGLKAAELLKAQGSEREALRKEWMELRSPWIKRGRTWRIDMNPWMEESL